MTFPRKSKSGPRDTYVDVPETSTICAIATAPGEASIGVIRVSGSEALSIVSKHFKSASGKKIESISSHHAVLGKIVDQVSGKFLDEVLCTPMRAPHSYTGEDVVEISAHGNPRILSAILESLLRSGARLAERGEFTKRAFLNGKLDLAQAEAVIDTVRAATSRGLDLALDQLDGKLSKFLKDLRQEILSILSPIEAGIDFPEEEVPPVSRQELMEQIDQVIHRIQILLAGAHAGRVLREGFSSVIVGKPNVGKSSLLNALLRENRAIVTEIPGTTRDTIEEWADIGGVPMRLIDTAGIRKSGDRVEQIGILRSKEALAKGDLALVVLDRSTSLEDHDFELLEAANARKGIVALNKMDLPGQVGPDEIKKFFKGAIVPLSIIENRGLDLLEKEIVSTILKSGITDPETPLITRLRHQECLERAKFFLEESRKTLQAGLAVDLAAGDLRGAVEAIGQITGESYTEDLLNKIFSEFCIGK